MEPIELLVCSKDRAFALNEKGKINKKVMDDADNFDLMIEYMTIPCAVMPANLPVSELYRISRAGVRASIGRKIARPGAVIGARRSPSAKFHLSWPVSGLVNLRIWPSHAIDAHSGFVRFLTPF